MNCTVPAGMPLPSAVTIAVNVTGSSIFVGFLSSLTVIAVEPVRTWCERAYVFAKPRLPVTWTSKTQFACVILSWMMRHACSATSTFTGRAGLVLGMVHGGCSGGQVFIVNVFVDVPLL